MVILSPTFVGVQTTGWGGFLGLAMTCDIELEEVVNTEGSVGLSVRTTAVLCAMAKPLASSQPRQRYVSYMRLR